MKTIIVVTFFGILACVFVTSTETSKCQEVTPMAGLDVSKFYNGTWYVTHARNTTGPLTCVNFYTTKAKGDNLIVKYDSREGIKDIGQCKFGNKEEGDQKVPFICTSGENHNIQIDVTVIYTDYDNFGVFYRCIKTGDTFVEDNYLGLSRKSTIEEFPDYVKKSLPEQLSLSKCPSIPEEETGEIVKTVML